MADIVLVSYWDDISNILPQIQQYKHIFATEKAAMYLVKSGIHVEAAIADFDSLENKEEDLAVLAAHTHVEVLPEEKDLTDTRAIVDYITKTHGKNICVDIYNSFDGRIDHALALLSLFDINANIAIYTPQSKLLFLSSGTTNVSYDEEYTYVSFVGLTDLINFKLTGFKYDTDVLLVPRFSDFLVSNELSEGAVGKVAFTRGTALLIYSRDK